MIMIIGLHDSGNQIQFSISLSDQLYTSVYENNRLYFHQYYYYCCCCCHYYKLFHSFHVVSKLCWREKSMIAHVISLAIASLQNYWPLHCFIKQQYNYIVFGQYHTV